MATTARHLPGRELPSTNKRRKKIMIFLCGVLVHREVVGWDGWTEEVVVGYELITRRGMGGGRGR